jgi:signal peptidase I
VSSQPWAGRRVSLAPPVALFRVVRTAWRLSLFFAVGFALTIAAAAAVPALFGMHSFTILSGSMTPTIRVGDVVVDRSMAPLDARVGDIVTFNSPGNSARLITHRVIRMRALGDNVSFVTRGDANTGVERWSVPVDGRIGRVVYHLPKIGYAANFVGSKLGRLLFLVLPATLLGIAELRRFLRGPVDGRKD